MWFFFLSSPNSRWWSQGLFGQHCRGRRLLTGLGITSRPRFCHWGTKSGWCFCVHARLPLQTHALMRKWRGMKGCLYKNETDSQKALEIFVFTHILAQPVPFGMTALPVRRALYTLALSVRLSCLLQAGEGSWAQLRPPGLTGRRGQEEGAAGFCHQGQWLSPLVA